MHVNKHKPLIFSNVCCETCNNRIGIKTLYIIIHYYNVYSNRQQLTDIIHTYYLFLILYKRSNAMIWRRFLVFVSFQLNNWSTRIIETDILHFSSIFFFANKCQTILMDINTLNEFQTEIPNSIVLSFHSQFYGI